MLRKKRKKKEKKNLLMTKLKSSDYDKTQKLLRTKKQTLKKRIMERTT